MKSSNEPTVDFSFKGIITDIICSNGKLTEYKAYPYIKEIFNIIFADFENYCQENDIKRNRLSIKNEGDIPDSKKFGELLRRVQNKRYMQKPQLRQISLFWSYQKNNYDIESVLSRIKQCLNKDRVYFAPASSAYKKYFDSIHNAYISEESKGIIKDMLDGDKPFNDKNYSEEAFVYLLVSSLYIDIDDSLYSSATFNDYLKARKEQIELGGKFHSAQSPSVSAEIQNSETAFRLRLNAVAAHQLNTVGKYAGRLSELSHISEDAPSINIPVLKDGTPIILHEQITSGIISRACLIGTGGAGKSCCLVALGQELLGKNTIPLYIPLNSLHGNSIAEYILKLLDAEYTDAPNNKTAVRDFLNGELGYTSVLLLDGFNEITAREERSCIAEKLRKICLAEHKKLRVIIASRYDITELYDYESYEKLTLAPVSISEAEDYLKNTIPEHYRKVMDMISEHETSEQRTLLPFMTTPMAIALAAVVYKQEAKWLVHEKSTNLGQLIENYIQCISGLDRDSFFSDETVDQLAYAGLNMSLNGSFDIDSGNCFNGYIRNTVHTDKAQFISSSLFRSFTKQMENRFSFIHQNFRDAFAALYLHSVLLFADSVELNQVFERSISSDVRKLLADMVAGSDCVKKQLSENFDFLSAQCVGQLISVAAEAEEDLSEYDLSELDLTASRLNSVKLFNSKKQTIADLSNSKINLSTISASGHTGKIDALLFLMNRFVVSFARDSFYCFDMEQKKQYVLTYCESTPVTDAMKYSDDTIIVNHTSGKISVYKFSIVNDRLYFDLKDSIEHSAPKSHSIVQHHDRVYGVCYDGTIFSFVVTDYKITNYVQTEYKADIENGASDALNFHTGPRISVWGERLAACFGNNLMIFRIKNGKLISQAEITETSGSDIHDMIAYDGYLYLNIRTKESTEIVVYDSQITSLFRKRENHTRSFFGIDRFSSVKSGLYAAVNIEDSMFQAGAWKISLSDEGIKILPCFGTRHTMPVNVCLPFRYKKQDYIATGSTDRSVEILKEKDGELTLIHNILGHYEGIHSFCMTKSGGLITAQYSGEIALWKHTENGWKCCDGWKHTDWAWHVRCVKLGKKTYAISCSYDHSIMVYNLTDHECSAVVKSNSRVTTLGVTLNENRINLIYGVDKADGSTNTLNAIHTALSFQRGNASKTRITSDSKRIPLNAAIKELPDNIPVRCIESCGETTLICCGDRAFGSRVFIMTNFGVTETENTFFAKISIRCVSFTESMTVYGGDNTEDKRGKILLVKDKPKEILFNAAVSCVRVFRYQNDKEQSNYFAVGTYGCMLYIYNDKGEQIYSKATGDKVLCIQTSKENLMYSTLSGEIYSIPLKEALADAVDFRNEIGPALIIKSTSGFSGFCGADFSECCKTDLNGWNTDFLKRFSFYIDKI